MLIQRNLMVSVAMVISLVLQGTAIAAESAAGKPKAASSAKSASAAKQARGKYMVKIAGCNDCHTPGYMAMAGKVDEKQWLTGDVLGWRGPWGTTYAVNLRLYFDKITEDQWLKTARSIETRPPMPWFALRDMTEADLRAIHAYVKSLGPAGGPAPAYVPPDKEPKQPYAQFPSPPPKK